MSALDSGSPFSTDLQTQVFCQPLIYDVLSFHRMMFYPFVEGNHKGCPYAIFAVFSFHLRATTRVATTRFSPSFPFIRGQPQGLPLRVFRRLFLSFEGNHKGCPYAIFAFPFKPHPRSPRWSLVMVALLRVLTPSVSEPARSL